MTRVKLSVVRRLRAPRLPGDPAPWLLTIVAGTLLTSGGFVGLLRWRRAAAAA